MIVCICMVLRSHQHKVPGDRQPSSIALVWKHCVLQPRRKQHQGPNLWANLHWCVRPPIYRSEKPSRISASKLLWPKLRLLTSDIVKLSACGGVSAIIEIQYPCDARAETRTPQ